MNRTSFMAGWVVAALIGAVPVVAVATDNTPAACVVVAGTPYNGGSGLVTADVGRTGCSSNSQTVSKLIHSRPYLPDVVVAHNTKNIRNHTYPLSARRTSGHGYISESKAADGGYARSGYWKAP